MSNPEIAQPSNPDQALAKSIAAAITPLLGGWQVITQLGATGLICLLFWIQFNSNIQQAKDDRAMYREHIDSLIKEANIAHIEAAKSRSIVESNTLAIRELSAELRKSRLEKQ